MADSEEKATDPTPRLRPILSTLARASGSSFSVLANLLVLAHHPKLTITGFWIDLVRAAGVDPQMLVDDMVEELLKLVWEEASTTPDVSSSFSSFRAQLFF